MGVEKTTVMVLKVDLQCSCCYKKVKKVLCRFPQIRDQIYDEKANTVTITVICCSPERIQDKLCYKGGKAIKSIEIKEPGKPKPPPADKPKDAPKPAEKPKEAPKPAEKPKEAPKPAEKPKEAAKPAEKPKEAAKPAEKPKDDKPKEAPKAADKPKGDGKPAEKPAGDKPPAQAPAPAPKAPAPEQGIKAAEMSAFHPVSVFGYPQGYPVAGMSYEPSYEGYAGVPSYQGYGTPVPVPRYNDLYGPYGHPPPPPSYGYNPNPNYGYGFDGGYGNAPSHHGGNREYFTEDSESTCTIM